VVNGCPQPDFVFLDPTPGFQFIEFPYLRHSLWLIGIRKELPNKF
jgi:hypothetical protein